MKPLVAATVILGAVTAMPAERPPRFANRHFYDAKGNFLVEKAKDAYLTLMKFHGYPIFPGLRDKLSVSDFGTGRFLECGVGSITFCNDEKGRYMLMDIFLLPKQMLPEHWHEATDDAAPKLAGWLVRHGMAHVVTEGDSNLPADLIIPQCHAGGTVTAKHGVLVSPGEFVALKRQGERHWLCAGPEGAILTEVGTYHDRTGTRFLDPKINDAYHGKK
ncbi:MAG: hypothetical protein N3I86_13955 [Verrucomicrobiae bacterium]|nr:hypothetical protein [Verrucomicrobiae bacterium]